MRSARIALAAQPGAADPGPDGDPRDARIEALERQVAKLTKINGALINRVEQSTDQQGNSFSLFQTAIVLERQVRDRTEELQHALTNLEQSNRELTVAKEQADLASTRLTEAIESLSEGFVLYDADDRLVLTNSKYRALFPDMEDVIKPGTTFVEFLRTTIARKVVTLARENVHTWLRRRVQQHRHPRAAVLQGLTDGRWLQISERRTTSGGTVGIYTDVTEIKKVETQRRERELEEKSLQLTATLDNLAQGVSVFDHDHKLAYWNSRFATLMGLPPELVREGTPFEAILGCEPVRAAFPNTDLCADLIRWAHSGQRRGLLRTEYRRHDGLVVEVQRNAMPDGGFVSTYTDVTDQRRAARVLEEAKELLERRVTERTVELTELNDQLRVAKAVADRANLSKTKFLAAASHDLLQPLNAARLFVSALSDAEVPRDAARLIERVDAALESVDELLKAVFDISKFDTGIIVPEWSDFCVADLLNALAGEYAFLAEEKGLSLRVVPSRVVIHSDMLLLRRILQNFLGNAIRYTQGGRVLVGCRRMENALSIQVWDTGPGIPDQHQEAVFEEFQRFAPPDAGRDAGVGLGLAIAQRSARVLGLSLRVRSEVGKGSMFSVEVPIGRTAQVVTPQLSPQLLRNYGLRNATVVFVENDEDNLEGMTALLRGWSCRVLRAHTAAEAMRAVSDAECPPDLIIADYHLDEGHIGLDAIAEVRALCSLPIPGIVVTADHTARVQEAAKSAGYEILQKPIKPAELRSLMAHLLA